MEIKVGYELIYDCPQPTPMMLVLHIHYSRASDIIVPDHVTTTPSIPISAYRDGFGNWCTRLVAPAGRLRIASTALVRDSGEPDIVAPSAQQHSIEELPEECAGFSAGEPLLRHGETHRRGLEPVWPDADGLGPGPGHLRFRAQPYLVRL